MRVHACFYSVLNDLWNNVVLKTILKLSTEITWIMFTQGTINFLFLFISATSMLLNSTLEARKFFLGY